MRSIVLLCTVVAGCLNPEDLSGSYQGTVRGAAFVRRGFAPETTATLTLDLDGPRRAQGTLSTSDLRFVDAPVAPLGAASVDLLGEADLPGTGPVLLLLSAPTSTGEEALLVVSLGGEAGDELRIAYGRDETPDALYGVFPLRRAP